MIHYQTLKVLQYHQGSVTWSHHLCKVWQKHCPLSFMENFAMEDIFCKLRIHVLQIKYDWWKLTYKGLNNRAIMSKHDTWSKWDLLFFNEYKDQDFFVSQIITFDSKFLCLIHYNSFCLAGEFVQNRWIKIETHAIKQYVSPIKSNLYTMNKSFDAKIVFSQKIMFVLHDYRRFNLFSITYFSFSSFFPNAWTSMLFFLKIRNGLLLWKLFYYSK